jgi:hypothetical protein
MLAVFVQVPVEGSYSSALAMLLTNVCVPHW